MNLIRLTGSILPTNGVPGLEIQLSHLHIQNSKVQNLRKQLNRTRAG